MDLCYGSVSGDLLTLESSSHRGSPDTVDANGQSKRQTYDAAVSQDIQYFKAWADVLNSFDWLKSMTSERTFVRKGDKVRPIDVPPEIKRAYAAYLRTRVCRLVRKTDWIHPMVIGFRDVHDFDEYADRKDGITIQDIYASTVWRLIQANGPWVVLIDLADAFGNLPHKAIHEGLKALWIPHEDRRRLIETIRIRTNVKNKGLLKPRAFGIEQGNPLSPDVFNVVMSLVVRRMNKVGVNMACYGDDIVLVQDSEESAIKAFEYFVNVTNHMGFQNVRPLGVNGKATRIFNTEIEPVPLIKTYLVGRNQIALQADKEEALKAKFRGDESFKGIRKANVWKVASKSFLKMVVP